MVIDTNIQDISNRVNIIVVAQEGYSTLRIGETQRYLYTGNLKSCVGLAVHDEINQIGTLAHLSVASDIGNFFREVLTPLYGANNNPKQWGIAGGWQGYSEYIIGEIEAEIEAMGNSKIVHKNTFQGYSTMKLLLDIPSGVMDFGLESKGNVFFPDYEGSIAIPRKKKKNLIQRLIRA